MKNYYEAFQDDGSGAKKSSPGIYQGYSPKIYDGYIESSEYVAVRDGTRLAVELYRPSQNGLVVQDPLPVIWRLTPYGRVLRRKDGSIRHTAFFSGTGAVSQMNTQTASMPTARRPARRLCCRNSQRADMSLFP